MAEAVLVLIWLGAAGSLKAHRAELDAFAHARHVRLELPRSAPPRAKYPEDDPGFALEIETRLEQARHAAGASEDALARQSLGEVEETLRAHPELPQAAWLMAERFSIEAQLLERDGESSARAALLRRAAAGLEGPRARVFKPPQPPDKPGSPAPKLLKEPSEALPQPDSLPAASAVRISGLAPEDRLEWDGLAANGAPRAEPGLHQVRVLRSGRLVWASWVNLDREHMALDVALSPPERCSREDLASVQFLGDRVVPPPARCERWAAARPAAQGGIEIAVCSGARCGRPEVFRSGARANAEERRRWPAFTPYALLGLGVAATGAIVLWRLGAFDKPEPERERVVYSGGAALRF